MLLLMQEGQNGQSGKLQLLLLWGEGIGSRQAGRSVATMGGGGGSRQGARSTTAVALGRREKLDRLLGVPLLLLYGGERSSGLAVGREREAEK